MDGNNKLIVLNFVSLFFFLTMSSCLNKQIDAPYPYLAEINNLRQEVGLKVIDSTFMGNNTKSYSTYSDIKESYSYRITRKLKPKYRKPPKKPDYWMKSIRLERQTGKPKFEMDIFRSGFYKFGFMEETDIYEQLKFIYVFEDYKYYRGRTKDSILVKKGWQYKYEYPVEKKGVTSNRPQSKYWVKKIETINKSQADSILKSWGLEY